MRHFFKFLAVFLPFSLQLVSEEETEIVKIEVATLVWKDQATSEKFKKAYVLPLADLFSFFESNVPPNKIFF